MKAIVFLSTPSARRATRDFLLQLGICLLISIHALREEGDRGHSNDCRLVNAISIHALREEGDYQYRPNHKENCNISIHALREEGDPLSSAVRKVSLLFLSTPSARRATRGGSRKCCWIRFLSTPSARRATITGRGCGDKHRISIHALREEGDPLSL